MGQQWDGGDIAFRPETWAAMLRVLKPGGYIVAFSSSRTFGRRSVAVEDAGFVTHPMLGWISAQGFPKATRFKQPELAGWRYGLQALKPALEPIYMGQKPLDGTGSQNRDRWGCGGLNVDGCRVRTTDSLNGGTYRGTPSKVTGEGWRMANAQREFVQPAGRWPANLLHDGSPEVEAAFAAFGTRTSGTRNDNRAADQSRTTYGAFSGAESDQNYAGDTSSASRFFFAAKATNLDRCGSKHPTVKPTSLMRHLWKLVTPLGGTVLDPFAGSGTTGQAAVEEGFNAILIEREPEYCDDIRRRLALFLDQSSLSAHP